MQKINAQEIHAVLAATLAPLGAEALASVAARLFKAFGGGPFADELRRQLDLLRAGGSSVQQLLADFGDAVVRVNGEVKTLREVLQGLDLGSLRRQMQSLITDLKCGQADVGDVLAALRRTGSEAAEKGLLRPVGEPVEVVFLEV